MPSSKNRSRKFYEVSDLQRDQVLNWLADHGWLRDRPSRSSSLWTYDADTTPVFEIGPLWSEIQDPYENIWETLETCRFEHSTEAKRILEEMKEAPTDPQWKQTPYRIEVDEKRRKTIEDS